MSDLVGQKFGLVTVQQREYAHHQSRWFAVCECGKGRWFTAGNLRRSPPKTHKFCHRGVDTVRTDADQERNRP